MYRYGTGADFDGFQQSETVKRSGYPRVLYGKFVGRLPYVDVLETGRRRDVGVLIEYLYVGVSGFPKKENE